jgi:pimeloyl-ACP methyl ester carboxylesterase
MEWIAEHAPRATLSVLEGAGHFSFIEGGEAFVEMVASLLVEERKSGFR